MRDIKFTPGPWVVDMAVDVDNGSSETFAVYHCPAPNHIVEVIETPDSYGEDCIHGNDIAQIEANANLIAAAPELLEALEKARLDIEGLLDDLHGHKIEDYDGYKYIETAIKKAYGEKS